MPQTSHHIRPQSRGGKGPDEMWLADRLHSAWHQLFSNLTLLEVLAILPLWFGEDGEPQYEFMKGGMRTAWTKVFGKEATLQSAYNDVFELFGHDVVCYYVQQQLDAQSLDRYVAELKFALAPLLREPGNPPKP